MYLGRTHSVVSLLSVIRLVTVPDMAIATALVIARCAACAGGQTIICTVIIFLVFSRNSAKSERADIGVGKDTDTLRAWGAALAVVAAYSVASSFAGRVIGCAPAS